MTFMRRYWDSLSGGGHPPRIAARVHAGYGFWQRYWASLTVNDLPAKPARSAPERAFGTSNSLVMAATGDRVIDETSSPDGKVALFLRASGGYRLEAVLRDADTAPAVVSVSYGPRHLLIPLIRQRLGPPTAQLLLPGFEPGMPWQSSPALPMEQTKLWAPETITASINAAANQTTRHAWRAVREVVTEDLAAVIDQALR
ncbi:hypothetical protein [Amycolatopsis sp. WGS_07]|uniref:hypothetical protein n=1 Tax=Amycolatopsis sp. WGS_07 TaxID=3076764 RepID=UPI0038730A0B